MSNQSISYGKILILSTDEEEVKTLIHEIEHMNYLVQAFGAIADFKDQLRAEPCLAGILDIDSVPLDNRTIRELTVLFPSVGFLCTSRERFHPQLKEAISFHIFACLYKPVDPDELLYWLRCIRESEAESSDPPAAPR
ncbi:hypothetical protein D3OALGA1CA_1177 [Olavius algarvensis associated proteobacterium Delta 3]|nr:hypothetical protein D3OALGA1CA_1177 [Olavius algarvensis associated proteobacterium Delta 3]CAB5164352.1 hypothetical protein D3OALGB2SA_5647 [Olavius algarvensis associated proteobacterium Delta 3]